MKEQRKEEALGLREGQGEKGKKGEKEKDLRKKT